MCEICNSWARTNIDSFSIAGKLLVPNHHINCPQYNDSLIDVWKMTVNGISAYMDKEQDVIDCSQDEFDDETTVTKIKMHREIFENLPEFNGF